MAAKSGTEAIDSEPIVTYDCPVAGRGHTIPGSDVRIMRIGDGGFVVACECGGESLADVNEPPHPTTDHLMNIYANDPSPEEWVLLERAADGWYDTNPWLPPKTDRSNGTWGERRAAFRQQIEDLVDSSDGRDLDPTTEDVRAREVECPQCGATEGRKCKRPSGHRVRKPHIDRVDAARDANLLEEEQEADREQSELSTWRTATDGDREPRPHKREASNRTHSNP